MLYYDSQPELYTYWPNFYTAYFGVTLSRQDSQSLGQLQIVQKNVFIYRLYAEFILSSDHLHIDVDVIRSWTDFLVEIDELLQLISGRLIKVVIHIGVTFYSCVDLNLWSCVLFDIYAGSTNATVIFV